MLDYLDLSSWCLPGIFYPDIYRYSFFGSQFIRAYLSILNDTYHVAWSAILVEL